MNNKNQNRNHRRNTAPPEGAKIKNGEANAKARQYWAENVRLLCILLTIWFLVSFVAGILLVDTLNKFSFGGFPLGFWFAQQGSILVFVGLIFFYTYQMGEIERRFNSDDEAKVNNTAHNPPVNNMREQNQ